jgi:predicted anti-sigma-YlaC factor YlaD
MGCDEYREMLSARLDGEAMPGERDAVDAHLSGCEPCRTWYAQAAEVTRLVRVGSMVVVPSEGDEIRPRTSTARRKIATLLRLALGALGLAQFALGMAQVAGAQVAHPHIGGVSPGHLWHESAAWNVAIGAGFVWIAVRRTRTAGVLPILTAFVGLLGLLSVGDLTAGRVDSVRLFSHGFVLAGYLIMVVLSRPAFDPGRPPAEGDRPGARTQARTGGVVGELRPRPRLRLINGEAAVRDGTAPRRAA